MKREEPIVQTHVAHWGFDEHQYFGYAVFAELLPHESLMGLNALSVLGRRLSVNDCRVLEEAALALTMADARIWPLKLTRAVASYGRAIPAAAAGLLMLQDAQIGPWPAGKAAAMLSDFHARLQRDVTPEAATREVTRYLEAHGFLWGFGTPFRGRDERLAAFRHCIRARELDQRPHFRTFERIREAAAHLRNVEPNIVSALAAICLDMGLGVHEIGPLTTTLMQHMFFAHAVEAAREQDPPLRLLPDGHVRYAGAGPRQSPRAKAVRKP